MDNNNDIAIHIQRRANAVGLPITQLCREAGVSRRWFEYLKIRAPKSILIYNKIDGVLKEYERSSESL